MEERWEPQRVHGPGTFVTHEVWRRADGVIVELESRALRKRSPRLNARGRPKARGRAAVYWAPWRVTWWIAALFMIGATCFAAPSVPGFAAATSELAAAVVYFVGSLFFTSAGYLSFFESINAGRESGPYAPPGASGPYVAPGARPPRLTFVDWQPRRIDFWATGVQFVGTLFFNVNTFRSLHATLGDAVPEAAVWRPDAIGSICFLLASYLAWAEICHSFWRLAGRGISWWIAAVNMAGSIAFGISAIGAWQSPDGGAMLSPTAAQLGTLAGAVCFFAAAFLLLPEAVREDAPPSAPVCAAGSPPES
jgi:hypothetical protein